VDYESNVNVIKNLSDFVFILFDTSINWKINQQSTVVLSTLKWSTLPSLKGIKAAIFSEGIDVIKSSLSMWKETYKKHTKKMNVLFIFGLFTFFNQNCLTYNFHGVLIRNRSSIVSISIYLSIYLSIFVKET